MAYMTQEDKKAKAILLKPILAKYNIKGTLSINNHSTLVCKISSGKIDFLKNHIEIMTKEYSRTARYEDGAERIKYLQERKYIVVNIYHFEKEFSGVALECLKEIKAVLFAGNHNNSDSMTDYFDVGWYVDINIGNWDKPYILTQNQQLQAA
ncbi:MAG: hypothetical protein WC725_05170 [Patescibacteria group bacterium]|jgi:hypothetical protein